MKLKALVLLICAGVVLAACGDGLPKDNSKLEEMAPPPPVQPGPGAVK